MKLTDDTTAMLALTYAAWALRDMPAEDKERLHFAAIEDLYRRRLRDDNLGGWDVKAQTLAADFVDCARDLPEDD